MQRQGIRTGLKCPKCNQNMQGYSVSYHHYACLSCGSEINGLAIVTNPTGLEQVMGAICLIGLFALFIR